MMVLVEKQGQAVGTMQSFLACGGESQQARQHILLNLTPGLKLNRLLLLLIKVILSMLMVFICIKYSNLERKFMRRKDRIFEEIIQELEYVTNISLVTMFLPAVWIFFMRTKQHFSKKLRQKIDK